MLNWLQENGAQVAPGYWLAGAIFVLTFVAIVSEKVHKTKAALFGGALTMAAGILTQAEAFHSERFGIDHGVVFLLIGMMVLVNVLARTGLFEYAAILAAKRAGGRPFRIMASFAVLTAVGSAFLDNVTTVLLIAPVTLLIADELDIDPVPFLIVNALASNIGGTATLIGDPPNIMIASRAHLDFMDFIIHLTPAVIVMGIASLLLMKLVFGKRLHVDEEKRQRILAMDERKMIKDIGLARKALAVLVLTLLGFVLHGALHLEPATIALLGAATLLLISRGDPHGVFADVEWTTIFFFIGLFIVIGGIVKVGIVNEISQLVIQATAPTRHDTAATASVILWASAVLSAIVDNIPYVATMSPLVLDMANEVYHSGAADPGALPLATLHDPQLMSVWWALALGACLGGNATLIGASANVVVVGIAARAGHKISFWRFFGYGVPTVVLTVGIAHVYLALRYF